MDFLHTLEHHLLDHPIGNGIMIGHFQLPLTHHVRLMWIAAVALMIIMPLAARAWPTVPSGGKNLLEVFIIYIRDEIVLPNTGEAGLPYVPYFLSLFFFILFVNLLGLVPHAGSATGNISVTAALATCTLVLINVAGIRKYGFVQHFKNFIPHGLPVWLIPIMFPLEILGLFTRAFALSIRLFANMLAGHIVILAFLSLSFLLGSQFVNAASIPVAVGLNLLETFVCFLQAYIFTFLSAIFVGASLHPH